MRTRLWIATDISTRRRRIWVFIRDLSTQIRTGLKSVQHRYGFPLPACIHLSCLRMVCCRHSGSVGRHWDVSCVDRCREKGSMQDVHVSVADVILASGDEFIGAENPQSWSLSMVEIRLACFLAAAQPVTVNTPSG